MGHRANYAIRENGNVVLHYSHWGALTVAEDVFCGPRPTEEFIRKNEVTTAWLDNIWAEGGIALDKDNRHLTYDYFEWPLDEDVRGVYETLLAETWAAEGWTVQRAREWSDVAYAMGVDRASVIAEATGPGTITFEHLGRNLEAGFCCGLLSARTNGLWQDRAIDFLLPSVLMNGPELLNRLDTISDLEGLRDAFARRREEDTALTPGDWIDEYCAIDLAARAMRLSLPEHEEECVPFLENLWSGWSIVYEHGGAEAHFGHTGREVPTDLLPSPKSPELSPPHRSFDECVAAIRNHIDQSETRKSAMLAGHIRLVEKLNGKDGDGAVSIGSGFLRRIPSSKP